MEIKKIEIIKNFAPSWFAVLMGTGIIPVALYLNTNIVPIFYYIAYGFLIFSIALFVIVFIPWIIRFFKYFENIKSDFTHPVIASFFPTFAITIMIFSINFLVLGKDILGEALSLKIATVLFIFGGIGILLFGVIIFPIIFLNNKVAPVHANFGWFIPSVSHLFLPVVGLDLVSYFKGTSYAITFFVVSMIGLGIGFTLFIYVASAVYHRYIFFEPLISNLAPTIFIGIVPTALITTIASKLENAVSSIGLSSSTETIKVICKIAGLASWGFSIWWFLISIIVISYYILTKKMKFSLSCWALTFPVGALTVSTGNINKLYNLKIFDYTLTGFTVIMLIIWGIVAFKTLKSVLNKSVFEKN